MNLLTLDYTSLSQEEARDLILSLDEALDETTPDFSLRQKILAQALFAARTFRFYRQLLEAFSLPLPALYQDTMDAVWQYLLGDITPEALTEFLRLTSPVMTCLLTGSDDELDEAAWTRWGEDWAPAHFDCIPLWDAALPGLILEQADCGAADWSGLPDNGVFDSIGNYICDCNLEAVFKTDGGYRYDELQRHLGEVFGSPTFAAVFALFQEDLRLVHDLGEPDRETIAHLRETYQNKPLFSPEQVTQITRDTQEYFKSRMPNWPEGRR